MGINADIQKYRSHGWYATLSIAISCLASPWGWSGIILLLLNDHIFKSLTPSWLTGKVSDFAGLFIFPFLLAPLLAAFLSLVNRLNTWSFPTTTDNIRRIGATSVILTGTIFALIKLSSPFNFMTGKLVAQLLGHPTAYLLDPTDLVALIVLYASWHLWLHPPKFRVRNLRWVALVAGALSVIATSPEIAPPVFNRLVVSDGVLYAAEYRPASADSLLVASSTDGGLTWDQVYLPDLQGLPYNFQSPSLPYQVCLPDDPSSCFRITGSETIEMSEDGGQTWQVTWRPPPGRGYFMDRYIHRFLLYSGDPKDIDSGPYDVAVYDYEGETYLLAAMGNEGVLRRVMPDGEWERVAVLWAEPTPYGINDWPTALWILRYEIGIWILFAGGILVWTSLRAWDVVKQHDPHVNDQLPRDAWVMWPVIVGIFLGYLGGVVLWLFLATNEFGNGGLGLVLGVVVVLIGYLVTWERIAGWTENTQQGKRAGIWYGIIALVVSSLGVGIWMLWAKRIIPYYALAWVFVVGFNILVVYYGLRKARITLKQSLTPKTI